MQILEITTDSLAKAFINVSARLYQKDPNYIRPLNKDINEVFDAAKNKAFKDGEICRWILKDEEGKDIGRIAAFVQGKYQNKGDKQPVGCIGFFDCINDQRAANLLFDTAKQWLQQRGKQAMDGPVNFGERDKWWGLVIEGFQPPLYGMNYNFPYYRDLFEHYGFQVFYYQNCYSRKVAGRLDDRFYNGHEKLEKRGGFSARMVDKGNLEKYARDFVKVYNSAWAIHEGNKEMTEESAIKLFKVMKPVLDERIAWFAYFKEEPVGFYINLPDLNQIFQFFDGEFGILEKLRFLWFKKRGKCTKMVGIIFGVVPRFQSLGVDYFMIVEAAKVIQHQSDYIETELQWMGDWNPKINNIARHLDFNISRRLATFRYLFDRNVPFERHPIV
jgi:hypothetical protein